MDIINGKGRGFIKNGHVYMIVCFRCGARNWDSEVASGHCTWCEFDANAA
jgi:ribosomal protein L37E